MLKQIIFKSNFIAVSFLGSYRYVAKWFIVFRYYYPIFDKESPMKVREKWLGWNRGYVRLYDRNQSFESAGVAFVKGANIRNG